MNSVNHERLKIEAANLRDELKQAQAERDHLRMAAEDAVPLPVLNALQSAIGEYERAVLAQGLAPLDTVKRLYQAARAVIDPKGRVEFGEVTASVEAERDHLRRALEWMAGEFMWLIEPRVHSVEQIVVSALAITEEPA